MNDISSRASLQAWLLHWSSHKTNDLAMVQPHVNKSVCELTWGEVASQALTLAAYFEQLKLPKESAIAIYANNSAYWIIADMAIGLAGHISVPIYAAAKPSLCQYIIEHSEVKLVLHDDIGRACAVKDVLASNDAVIWSQLPSAQISETKDWSAIQGGFEPLASPVLPAADSLYTVAYTSGSTGIPKGVMHCMSSPLVVAEGLNQAFPLSPSDRLISYLPLAHLAERGCVEAAAIRFGLTVYFSAGLDNFVEDMVRARPTLFFSIPRLWTKFYKQAIELQTCSKGASDRETLAVMGLDQVRCAMSGSASLPAAIIHWFQTLGVEILECYGMSENFGYSHGSRIGEVRVGYVGPPSPGVECRLAENDEIMVKSPSTMLGYYKDEAGTTLALTADGFLKTGDRGEIDTQLRLKLTGRTKDLFKTSKGKYVAPLPIEMALCNDMIIDNVCVVGETFPQPVALIQLTESALASVLRDETVTINRLQEVLEAVNETLEHHEILAKCIVIAEPWTIENDCLTVTLKIKRSIIECRYQDLLSSWYSNSSVVVLHRA